MQGAGYLAIWSDLAPDDETDWAHWITREHGEERVGITGFLACRIFRALGLAANRYFILYALDRSARSGASRGADRFAASGHRPDHRVGDRRQRRRWARV